MAEKPRICSLHDCYMPHEAKGLCKTHYQREHARKRTKETPEYNSWVAMKQRCYNKSTKNFKDYGGRGIIVCTNWRKSYVNFISDMGIKPQKSYSIDRINTNGNYTCGHCDECITISWAANCKWASTIDQANNQRSNHLITFNGITMNMTQWAPPPAQKGNAFLLWSRHQDKLEP